MFRSFIGVFLLHHHWMLRGFDRCHYNIYYAINMAFVSMPAPFKALEIWAIFYGSLISSMQHRKISYSMKQRNIILKNICSIIWEIRVNTSKLFKVYGFWYNFTQVYITPLYSVCFKLNGEIHWNLSHSFEL